MLRLPAGAAPVTGLIACSLVAAAVIVGLRTPSEMELAPFPPRSVLDYDVTFRTGLPPLRAEFVREVLGGAGAALKGSRPGSFGPRTTARGDSPVDPFGSPHIEDTHPFVNDNMSEARAITGIPFTGRTNTSQATREPNEPRDCVSEGTTAWYRYTSPRDEELIANTFGSNYALSLGVYETSAAGSPKLVGCDSDLTGNALVQFPGRSETTYLFQITSRTTGGRLVFTLEPSGVTELVSATPSGREGSGQSSNPSLSADGRYVAFESYANDLMPDRPCEPVEPPSALEGASRTIDPIPLCYLVYVADRADGTMRLASVTSDGKAADNVSDRAHITGDGRFVVFRSHATNLDPRDSNDAADIYLHDFASGLTERVSVSSRGTQLENPIFATDDPVDSPSVSDDGRYIAFASTAANLVPGDTNDGSDVFVRDRVGRRTERVSVSTEEDQAEFEPNGGDLEPGWGTHSPAISSDGRYVAFVSEASNLVPDDTNEAADVFVRDLIAGTTEIVSVSSLEELGDGAAWGPAISAGGRHVAFASSAPNLVEGDKKKRPDIFVRDRLRGTTIRASVSSSGAEADQDSLDPTISRNGRYVAFVSNATTLAPGNRSVDDARSCGVQYTSVLCPSDMYVHDIVTRTTMRIPVAPSGELPAPILSPSISADGRTIAFFSGCIDCVPGLAQVWVHDRHRRRT